MSDILSTWRVETGFLKIYECFSIIVLRAVSGYWESVKTVLWDDDAGEVKLVTLSVTAD